MEVFIVTKELIVKELIRAKKESLLGHDSIDVDGDDIDIENYINDLLCRLVDRDYEDELRDIWDFEIRHIHESYCSDLKKALQNQDAYLFVVEQRGDSKKADYIKSHWDELDKMIDTLYNLCGLNVVEIPDGEQVEDIVEVEEPDEN